MIKKNIIIAGLILTLLSGGVAIATNYSFPQPGDANVGTPLRNFFGQTFNLNTSWLIDPMVDVRNYASIADAVSGIGSTPKTLLIASAQTVTTTVVFPSTLSVVMTNTGRIAKSGAGALVINGPFSAGLYQVFSGFSAGDVTGLQISSPEWFGAKGDGTTDDGLSFEQAVASVSGGGIFQLSPNKTYILGPSLTHQVVTTGPSGATYQGVIITNPLTINIPVGCEIKVIGSAGNVGTTPFIFNNVSRGKIYGAGRINGNLPAVGTNAAWGIGIVNSSNVDISEVEIFNTIYSGVRAQLSSWLDINNVYVHNCGNATYQAYGVVFYGVTHSQVRNGKFKNLSWAGLAVVQNLDGSITTSAQYTTFANNDIDSCGTVTSSVGGINIDINAPDTSIIGGHISNCGNGDAITGGGIVNLGGEKNPRLKILGVNIVNTNGYGIRLSSGTTRAVVEGNMIENSRYSGILVRQTSRSTIIGNNVSNSGASASPRYDGITIDAGSGFNIITGNTGYDTRNTPHQGWAVNEVAAVGNTNNTITGNSGYGNVLGNFNIAGLLPMSISNVMIGTFTMRSAESAHIVSDSRVQANSQVIFAPVSAGGAQKLGSSKNLYASAVSNGASFTAATGDSTTLGADTNFVYYIVNP